MSRFYWIPFLSLLAGTAFGQDLMSRVSVGVDAAGIFPVGGYKAEEYSTGPGLRVGGEVRLQRHVAAEAGWTGAWVPGISCTRLGCTYPRYQNKLLDYGLRGILPLANGRVELSIGLGGGYIWFDRLSGDSPTFNASLLQYSGKAAVAVDRRGHWRLNFTVRAWRDLGRPIQQWLSTSGGVSYGFGR